MVAYARIPICGTHLLAGAAEGFKTRFSVKFLRAIPLPPRHGPRATATIT